MCNNCFFILYKEGYENEPIEVFGSLSEAKFLKERIKKQLGISLKIKQKILIKETENESNNKTRGAIKIGKRLSR